MPSYQPLRIASAGACCSLGYDLASICAAVHARLNHFQETRFVGLGGKPIRGALAHDLPMWGAERQTELLRLAVEEAWIRGGERESCESNSTGLLLLLPESRSVALPMDELREAFHALVRELQLHPASRAVHVGKGGIATGVQLASRLLQHGSTDQPLRHVLLASVDSLLSAPRIEELLSMERLAHDDHTDALTPGEGAACLLLASHGETSVQDPAWIVSAAQTQDDWRFGGDRPARGHGLTEALREAVASAGMRVADMDFHAHGANGEHWYAKEVELALSRAMEQKREEFEQYALPQFIGDTGASLPVLTLAWADAAIRRHPKSIGRKGIVHFAGDDGQRSALVLARPQSLRSRARGLPDPLQQS